MLSEIHGPTTVGVKSAGRPRGNPEEPRIPNPTASPASSPKVPDSDSSQARLDSWKTIGSYLGRDVRTVQRWEKREGLPVHRHTHLKGSTVYAFKSEIDAWLASRSQTFSERRPMQRRLKHSANGLDLSSQVKGQMFEVFRLWLAVIERESCQGFDETVVPDPTLTPHDRYAFVGRPKSERKVRSRRPDRAA